MFVESHRRSAHVSIMGDAIFVMQIDRLGIITVFLSISSCSSIYPIFCLRIFINFSLLIFNIKIIISFHGY